MFSALGNLNQPPAAGAGTAAGAAATGSTGQQGQGPQPTHLLQSIADFLQQLQSQPGAGADVAMPVTSLALGGNTGVLAAGCIRSCRKTASNSSGCAGSRVRSAVGRSLQAEGGNMAGSGYAESEDMLQVCTILGVWQLP